MRKPGKIVIIGTGFVGASTAFALVDAGLATELVLIDVNRAKAEGEAMDLNHGISFVKPVKIWAGDYEDCKDADIIIITAGANQKPGETRLDLTHKNAQITKSIVENIIKYTQDAILLMVTNPVDVLTYVMYKVSGLPKNQIIGSGTVLDSSRFRYLLAQHCQVDVRNVHAYILGEHGDSEIAAWSLTNIGGVNFMQECLLCGKNCSPEVKEQIFNKVKNAAYEIIERKGATYYAIALAVRRIVEAIIRDENSILPVSSIVDDVYGVKDVAISLPAIVNKSGVVKVFDIPLTDEEKEKLKNSAQVIKSMIESLKL